MCLQYREGWISDAQTSFSREMNPHRKPNLKKTIRLGIGTKTTRLGIGITENAPSLSEWFTKAFELKMIYIYICVCMYVAKGSFRPTCQLSRLIWFVTSSQIYFNAILL